MENIIKVSIKNVYGKDTIYPACPISEAFADIAGTKTLTRQVVDHIKAIGFTIEVVALPTMTL